MRVLLARGPVVKALLRYDSGLRVRWSFEKKKWAVEAKAKRRSELAPPVRYEKVFDGSSPNGRFVERLKPELSDHFISYHDGYYVICWASNLDWNLYDAIVARDSQRAGGQKEVLRSFDDALEASQKRRQEQEAKEAAERVYAAYDKLKFLNRRAPWNDPVGAM